MRAGSRRSGKSAQSARRCRAAVRLWPPAGRRGRQQDAAAAIQGEASAEAVNLNESLRAYAWLMPWVREFDEPIALKDGRALATLADARCLMLALPEHQLWTHYWQFTADLLLKAAFRKGNYALAKMATGASGSNLTLDARV